MFRPRVPEVVQRATPAERHIAGPPQAETPTGPERPVVQPALALCRIGTGN
jgi:hypothetical protein